MSVLQKILSSLNPELVDIAVQTHYKCENAYLPADMQESVPYRVVTISNPKLLNISINFLTQVVTVRRLAVDTIQSTLTVDDKEAIRLFLSSQTF